MSPIARVPHGTEPHYQLGDLGLIPRPKHTIPTNFEKMKELSQTTRLGALKKVLTKSVGVQTVSSPKVRDLSNSVCVLKPLCLHTFNRFLTVYMNVITLSYVKLILKCEVKFLSMLFDTGKIKRY